MSDLQQPWQQFRRQIKMEDVRIHDLRHSYATFATAMQLSLKTIGDLLGHADTKTTEIYAHTMDDPMNASAEAVALHIREILGIPDSSPLSEEGSKSIGEAVKFIPKTRIPMPHYLTSDQAALYLSLDPKRMKDWRYRKAGPRYQRIRNRIRYCQTDLDGFLVSRTVDAGSGSADSD